MRHLKNRALACFVYSNEGAWTRDEFRSRFRSLFQGYWRSPTVEEPSGWRNIFSVGAIAKPFRFEDAATLKVGMPGQVNREQPLNLANIPPEDTNTVEFRMQAFLKNANAYRMFHNPPETRGFGCNCRAGIYKQR